MPKEGVKSQKRGDSLQEEVSKTEDINKTLVENFVSLQKVMTNLAIKFDSLSSQMSKLLELFEISAKSLAEKDYSLGENNSDKKVVEKLDSLLAQNKVIAKGLVLLHEANVSIPSENIVPQQINSINEIRPQNIPQRVYSKPLVRPLSPENDLDNSKVKNLE